MMLLKERVSGDANASGRKRIFPIRIGNFLSKFTIPALDHKTVVCEQLP
jgi:hypothetical protein